MRVQKCADRRRDGRDRLLHVPGFEGGGYATGMAGKLIELASSSPAVRRVVAHTLPETNASTRVLERVGMTFVGEVIDPEDGRVWRWQMQTGAYNRC